VHLRNAAGETVAQADSPPQAGAYLTTCWDAGETIVDETYRAAYTPTKGRVGLWVNAQLRINSLALKIFQGSPGSSTTALLNQVSIPVYQPGEVIFAWDQNALFYRPSWWGKENRPWNWTAIFDGAHPPKRVDSSILFVSIEKALTYFAFRPDLYDLPVEISAETTLTSKGGGAALFCRATSNGRYEFYLQPDGTWFIRRDLNIEYGLPKAKHLTILANGKVENFSPTNAQMSATCNGPDLIFSLNGVELGRVQDSLYPEGQVGIFFDVFSEGSFTNLVIKRAN